MNRRDYYFEMVGGAQEVAQFAAEGRKNGLPRAQE